MKPNKIFALLFLAGALLMSTVESQAQQKSFQTISGYTDTIASGAATYNMYCQNYNPSTEAIVQVELHSVAKITTHDTIYGVVAVWGSADNVSFIQLKQLDAYSANFSDSLTIATGTHGVGLRETKFWTYCVHRTSQPIPRYFKVVFTNKQVAVTDSTDVSATLLNRP